MRLAIEKYESIRRLKKEYREKLRSEMYRIIKLKNLQQKVQDWIRRANLSWVNICVSEPHSSGYRYCVIDIHSPSEAYIFWTDGGYHYHLLTSIFADDFGTLSHDEGHRSATGEIMYACKGLLLQSLSRKNIDRLSTECESSNFSCCHTKR